MKAKKIKAVKAWAVTNNAGVIQHVTISKAYAVSLCRMFCMTTDAAVIPGTFTPLPTKPKRKAKK